MGKEIKAYQNNIKYWKTKPVEIAEKLGYVPNKEFIIALRGFNRMLGKEEKKRRKSTGGKKGIVSNHLGGVAERYFRQWEPPLEKEKKKTKEI